MCYGQTPEDMRRIMGVWSKSRLKRRAWALTPFGFLEDFAYYFDIKLASIIFPTWFFWPPCHFEVMS